MRFTKQQVIKLAKEVSKETSNKYNTIVFQDGTFTKVNGSWEANKPVWVNFESEFTPQEVLDALWQACEDENGIPYTPK